MISSNFIKFSLITGMVFVLFLSPTMSVSFAQGVYDLPNLYKKANDHFMLGEYRQAAEVYDEILEISPENKKTLLMKGIALSNLDRHKSSILEFYNVNQQDPQDVTALIGLGVGFGNFGEYKQALTYFKQAYEILPENHIVQNYYEFATKTVEKYPYNEIEKPQVFTLNIPQTVPAWIKNTAGWWAEGQIPDEEFLKGINFLIGNGLLIIDIPDIQELTEDEKKVKDRNEWEFSRYLDRIENIVNKDKRYIEFPNPSNDVIKKFMRDYVKWNFQQQVEMSSSSFPDPTYEIIDETYVIKYNIFINDQPTGLPLDHASTLKNTFEYWENEQLITNDQNAKIEFEITNSKADANVWVTWVVRNIGEGVLGHAHLGKGVVEVALGDYNCDGSFQLYSVESVKTIMTHEIGHSIGLPHTNDKASIMYPSYTPSYAYCLLD